MGREGIDSLYVAAPVNVTYLTGFEFIAKERPFAELDFAKSLDVALGSAEVWRERKILEKTRSSSSQNTSKTRSNL